MWGFLQPRMTRMDTDGEIGESRKGKVESRNPNRKWGIGGPGLPRKITENTKAGGFNREWTRMDTNGDGHERAWSGRGSARLNFTGSVDCR